MDAQTDMGSLLTSLPTASSSEQSLNLLNATNLTQTTKIFRIRKTMENDDCCDIDQERQALDNQSHVLEEESVRIGEKAEILEQKVSCGQKRANSPSHAPSCGKKLCVRKYESVLGPPVNTEKNSCPINSDELIGQTTSSNTLHINNLPQPILISIFKFLSTKELLCCASLVCMQWYHIARDQDLWRSITLRDEVKLTDEVLLRVTSLSQNVQHLVISDSRLVTTDGIISMAKQCPNLQTLKLIRYQQLNHKAFIAIAKACHKLESLSLDTCFGVTDSCLLELASGCPKLKSLIINHCSRVTDNGIKAIAQSCPNLERLSADQCSHVTDESLNALSSNCKKLTYVSIMGWAVNGTGLPCLAELQDLRVLDLSQINGVGPKSLRPILKSCKYLIGLNLSLCNDVGDTCIELIAMHCPQLGKLNLVSCSITDQALVSLGKHCKSLTHLDVGWCQKVTDSGVRQISQLSHQHLSYLGLMRCDAVTISCIEELLNQYTTISYSTMYLDCKKLIERARREDPKLQLPDFCR